MGSFPNGSREAKIPPALESLQYHWCSICSHLPLLASVSLYASCCCFCLVAQSVSNSLQSHRLQPANLLCPWGFSRQGYWSRLPFPSPGDLPNLGIKGRSHALQADSLPSEPPGKPICLLRFLKLAKLFCRSVTWNILQWEIPAEARCFNISWTYQRPELKNKNKKKDSQCNQPTRYLSLK